MPEARVALARLFVLMAANLLPAAQRPLFEQLMYISDSLKRIREIQKSERRI